MIIKKILLVFILLLASLGCGNNGLGDIDRGISLVHKGKSTEGFSQIKKGLLKESVLKSYNSGEVLFKGDITFLKKGETSKIINNDKLYRTNISDFVNVTLAGDKLVVVSKDEIIEFMPKNKNPSNLNISGFAGNQINGIGVANNQLQVYAGGNLYKLNSDNETFSHIALAEKLYPPFMSQYYNTISRTSNNLTVVCSGNGGSYWLYVLNSESNTFLVTKIFSALNRWFVKNNRLYYLTGKSGDWQLVYVNLGDKTTGKIISFRSLQDLFFLDGYAIYLDNFEIHLLDLNDGITKKWPLTDWYIKGENNDFLILTDHRKDILLSKTKFSNTLNYLYQNYHDQN